MTTESMQKAFMALPLARQIQFAFPDEPDWSVLSDATLIELVRDFAMEQSCAGLALGELSAREGEVVGELSVFLLAHAETDKWLKQSALGSLPDAYLDKGLDAALGFIDEGDQDVLEKLAETVNYAFVRGKLATSLCNHEVIRQLRSKRLLGNLEISALPES